jgi:hypothetical protein
MGGSSEVNMRKCPALCLDKALGQQHFCPLKYLLYYLSIIIYNWTFIIKSLQVAKI